MIELVLIHNRSASSIELMKDTIKGYNAMLARQKKEPGTALVTTILFNNNSKYIQKRTPIMKVPMLTEKTFDACGATALLDAIGNAVEYIDLVHKYANKEELPQETLFVIATDGMENASRQYTYQKVRSMIESERVDHGWDFLFLGADFDVVEEARNMGIDESRAVRFRKDAIGKALSFDAINTAISCVREGMPVGVNWKTKVEKDCRTRRGSQRKMPDNMFGYAI